MKATWNFGGRLGRKRGITESWIGFVEIFADESKHWVKSGKVATAVFVWFMVMN
jgi:hypothetical protein